MNEATRAEAIWLAREILRGLEANRYVRVGPAATCGTLAAIGAVFLIAGAPLWWFALWCGIMAAIAGAVFLSWARGRR